MLRSSFQDELKLNKLKVDSFPKVAKNDEMSICLSVDVEEYFHAANLAPACPITSWSKLPSTVVRNTNQLLDLFDLNNSKGTFFILGYVAKREPALVKEIQKRGHEVASHGQNHKIAYHQSPKQFLSDISRSKKTLEDISGVQVKGYRAPNFSIINKNIWAYSCLIEAGYQYDSSLHPISHSRYGNLHRNNQPEIISSQETELKILPLTTRKTILGNIPVAGGAYWRMYPNFLLQYFVKHQVKHQSFSPICYIHPWEIDTTQPYFPQISLTKRIRHYYGVKSFLEKLDKILANKKSVTIATAYELDKS